MAKWKTQTGHFSTVIVMLVGAAGLLAWASFEKRSDRCHGLSREACGARKIDRGMDRILLEAEGTDTPSEEVAMSIDQDKVEEVPTEPLPQCYSSPDADPSRGTWRISPNGVEDSPANLVGWDPADGEDHFIKGCSVLWDTTHTNQEPMPWYTWEAEDCSLAAIDPEHFCRLMEGRKGILLAGDSLTHEMTTTLAAILRAEVVVRQTVNLIMEAEWSACNGTLPIAFKRNDYLATDTEDFNNNICPGTPTAMCTVFADDSILSRFDTLVVNSGAHPKPLETYAPAMEIASKALTASMARLHGDKAILVVRNTATGHAECNERQFEGPVELDVALRLIAEAPASYCYTTFEACNAALKEAFGEGKWWYLDAYTPTILRADSHYGGKDCLHYCVPGPIEHWVRLLYNVVIVATGADGLP